MQKKHLMALAIAAAVSSTASVGFAASSNPFDDVPADHWAYGAVYDHTFSKKFNGSIGYYHYKSNAYNGDALQIGATVLNYKLMRTSISRACMHTAIRVATTTLGT